LKVFYSRTPQPKFEPPKDKVEGNFEASSNLFEN
jgi:hypothetical protein